MKKVFIDGAAGTTGLNIHARLAKRNDVEVIEIDEDKRKNISERKKLMNMADVVFLCLPDDAARGGNAYRKRNNMRYRHVDRSQMRRRLDVRFSGAYRHRED